MTSVFLPDHVKSSLWQHMREQVGEGFTRLDIANYLINSQWGRSLPLGGLDSETAYEMTTAMTDALRKTEQIRYADIGPKAGRWRLFVFCPEPGLLTLMTQTNDRGD